MISNQASYFIQKVIDASLSRSCGIWYTNTTGKTLFVIANFIFSVTVAGDKAIIRSLIYEGSIDFPHGISAENTGKLNLSCILVVPPGHKYKMLAQVTGSASIGINGWIEAY